jgi:hypothetical protein
MPKGDELWLEMGGELTRWILRPDDEGGGKLIAMPAGSFRIDKSWYRGEKEATDIGAYELIEGGWEQLCFELFFTGRTLQGKWLLQKINADPKHRSWSFRPVR